MRDNQISDKEHYIQSLFAIEDEGISSIYKDLRPDEARMQISPVEGKTLHMLAKMVGAKKIVEIGSLAGYSAVWMARALPEGGKLYAIDTDYKKEERILNNLQNCNVSDKVELIIGKALDELPKLSKYAPFDMVFIDADKANYVNYLDWAEQNTRKGGLIIGDNTFLFGSVYGNNEKNTPQQTIDKMKLFNERLAEADKYTSVILPTVAGMTVALKNF